MNQFLKFILFICISYTATTAQTLNYIPKSANTDTISHTHYKLSYLHKYHDAEWVAYKLEDWMVVGSAVRSNHFRIDPTVLDGTPSPTEYLASGFDKGHLCPAADMKWEYEAMDETFFMSNMTPQLPGFNRGIWKHLEEKVRDWVLEDTTLYIVSGAVLTDSLPTMGRKMKVTVPRYFYKIIVEYKSYNTKAIAFIIPNAPSTRPLTDYVVTIDSVERVTKINFFPDLNGNERKEIELKSEVSKWKIN